MLPNLGHIFMGVRCGKNYVGHISNYVGLNLKNLGHKNKYLPPYVK